MFGDHVSDLGEAGCDRSVRSCFDHVLHLHGFEDGEGVAGFVTYTIDFMLWTGGDILRIDDLFVRERARGAGAGTALMARIDAFAPDLVVLAGFMRILSGDFVRHYQGRLLNIHPSLLPKYKGLHTHRRALEAGDAEHGCSVHFVTEELDGGPLVVQAVVPVASDDTVESLAQRVHRQEHLIYPLAVRWFAEGRLRLGEQGALLDGQPLAASGHLIRS